MCSARRRSKRESVTEIRAESAQGDGDVLKTEGFHVNYRIKRLWRRNVREIPPRVKGRKRKIIWTETLPDVGTYTEATPR